MEMMETSILLSRRGCKQRYYALYLLFEEKTNITPVSGHR